MVKNIDCSDSCSNICFFLKYQGDGDVKSKNSTSSKDIEEKKALKGESSKGLNLANLQVGENIRRAEKDLIHLKASLGRQQVGTPAYSAIASKVACKEKEINQLQESERRIKTEQNVRQGNKKMAIF